jgi:hypothetical protein
MSPAGDALLRLEEMLVSFVDGTDRSLRFANEIEGVLLDHFRDDEAFEDLLIALASYRPGGGDYLYDEDSLRRVCSEALTDVRARLIEGPGSK